MPAWGSVLTAAVTPFDPAGRIDDAAFARLVDHLFAHGSSGLVVCGTTGESPTLTHAEKLHLYGLAREVTRGRGPVLAGAGTNSTADTVLLCREAAAIGVDGLLLVSPYYNKPSQEGLYQHFRAAAEATDLPVMLYNVPGRTAVNVQAATVLRLARDVPNVVALKEAGGDMLQATEVIAGTPRGFAVYSGDDGLVLPLLAVGAAGVVSVTSHLVGDMMQRMCAAFGAGDHAAAAALHARMLPVVRACFQPSTPSPAPVKAGLGLLGVEVGPPRLPLVPATPEETDRLRAALAGAGVL